MCESTTGVSCFCSAYASSVKPVEDDVLPSCSLEGVDVPNVLIKVHNCPEKWPNLFTVYQENGVHDPWTNENFNLTLQVKHFFKTKILPKKFKNKIKKYISQSTPKQHSKVTQMLFLLFLFGLTLGT